MKMIPDVLLGSPPSSEVRVFERLAALDLGQGWYAFHSLNLAEHEYKRWSEIDFLILGPSGVLVLEVKGGRVGMRDGLWEYTDRWGKTRSNREGPFRQASSAMFSLEKQLAGRSGYQVSHPGIVFGFGVLLIDVDWDLDTPETPADVVCDRLTFSSPRRFATYLRRLYGYWERKQRNARELSLQEIQGIRLSLRPKVDLYPPFSSRIGMAAEEMQSLTDEQYDRMEIVEQNDRVIVRGGAGTGKTFLLLQCARREIAFGRKVLVVVESELLAAHLSKVVSDSGVDVRSIREIDAGRAPPCVDVLLVDEGQDLLTLDVLVSLSECLAGGIDQGRWRWFMDENRQAGIRGEFDPEALEYLESGLTSGGPTRVMLTKNCRNTRPIVQSVEAWTGARIGSPLIASSTGKPKLHIASDDDIYDALNHGVHEVLESGVDPDDVAIVFPKSGFEFQPSHVSANLRRRLTPLDVNTVKAQLRGRILFGSVADFKGLERPVVFLMGFRAEAMDEQLRADLYVAATRGNFGLHLIVDEVVAAKLSRMVQVTAFEGES